MYAIRSYYDLSLLKKNARDDIKLGFTQIGTHRDDLITKINGLNSRDYGSQGQQRSIEGNGVGPKYLSYNFV